MSRRTKDSLLVFGALALTLGVAPLTAQTVQPATASATTAKSVKVAKVTTPTASPVAAPPQKGMVWVNTASGAYHLEGTKYYGKTKQGKYMTEADAQKAGYHVAKNEAKQ